MDEEELQKRFTDCVYFLASPLTCKKGIECEFRHNEIARLNPRDCWYWLGGCCCNPECAFRHPPLEGLKEAYYESINPNNGPTLPVDKTNLPCYFYSKGFCNKADRCPFLHEPADNKKPIVKNEVPCEKKLNNTVSTPVQIVHTQPDAQPNTAQTQNTHTVMNHTPDDHQLASRRESVESEEHVEHVEREEFVESEEDAAESEEIVVQSESDVYNDQSSDGYVERVDVFVEGESGRLEYEEEDGDVDFFLVNEEDHRELNFRYPIPEYDFYDKDAAQPRVSIFNRLSFKKRNVSKKLIFNVQRGSDLREHLTKSKVVDLNRRIRRNFRRGEVDFDRRGSLRKAVPVNRYRPLLKKPRFFSSDGSRSRKPAQHKRESRESQEQSAAFSGPKTLDQIKEEKKKARENRDLGSNNGTGLDGVFQGPRPLSEILKNKRKMS
ncbi:putative transcription factor C3H family [Helianthus annuus]|uniref:Putative zinc finger, CCCH-type n=1 Tax=Helianthus annuus TaxID=4232 RepID=A0A251TT98_HELAN|nr:zinc finger CCCH domain-containing protein 17 [Helianthus annuus]KAF5789102.1 putative transcription factor C3H family [Helianthus annuus]KAJ0532301.1 putative transcription factor C3H family [Helianthus annuus]KAJ0540851.1 putative transcription factor C3H family [Helianthus annuus]KAJ0710066.1 putative transcription factor C3H family [Helianthus annuus]KAJ0886322.1 putative transcription factor C3H family [Helianthus annuus]